MPGAGPTGPALVCFMCFDLVETLPSRRATRHDGKRVGVFAVALPLSGTPGMVRPGRGHSPPSVGPCTAVTEGFEPSASGLTGRRSPPELRHRARGAGRRPAARRREASPQGPVPARVPLPAGRSSSIRVSSWPYGPQRPAPRFHPGTAGHAVRHAPRIRTGSPPRGGSGPFRCGVGGQGGVRTHDLRVANAARYRLRYKPLVTSAGFEPAIFRVRV
jgi:hypothetical protein